MFAPRRCCERHQVLLLAILEESFCRRLVGTRAAAAVQQAPRRKDFSEAVEACGLVLAHEGSQVAPAAFGRGVESTATSGHVELASVLYPGRCSPPLPELGRLKDKSESPGCNCRGARSFT